MKTTTIFGVEGIAEWDPSPRHLYLTFLCRDPKGPLYRRSIAPHGLEEIPDQTMPTQAHIYAAIAVIEHWQSNWDKLEYRMETGCSEDPRRYFNGQGSELLLLFSDRFPSDALPWYSSDWEMAEDLMRSLPFKAILTNSVTLPKECDRAKQIFQGMAQEYLHSKVVQDYLEAKAKEMADFWKERIEKVAPSLAESFLGFMFEDIIWSFSRRMVPYYSTDYGAIFGTGYVANGYLSPLLKKMDRRDLASYIHPDFGKHFNFDDAPTVEEFRQSGGK